MKPISIIIILMTIWAYRVSAEKLPFMTENVTFKGVGYRVVRMKPETLEIAWKGGDGKPMRSFDLVQQHYQKRGKKCLFLMNAGIYEPGGIPSGLHVQNGKQHLPLNQKGGWGNFYLKPNGVFCIMKAEGKQVAQVMTSVDYAQYLQQEKQRATPVMAVQSGPMLLSKGKIHHKFRAGSDSTLIRNGVGVDKSGRVVFAITDQDQEVNLHGFASLFLHLGCSDALFLDGDISRVEVKPERPIRSHLFGAIFVVTESTQP